MSSILIAALANVLIAAGLTACDRSRADLRSRRPLRRKLQLVAAPLARNRGADRLSPAKDDLRR